MLGVAAAAVIIAAIGPAAAASQWPASSFAAPHPAVVRVVAPERDGMSFGSGTLVEANETFGIVLTNWHVVRDASGRVGVVFPDGFRSAATVMRTDRDWDLAALLIWRPPKVRPIPLAARPPQPGELLTIAGYGSGPYRASAGRCTQFVSPGGNHPYEMIELDTPARDGDSGGPILNERGELAGVLFGSAFGRTTGSHSGRVGWFLGAVAGDFQRVTAETQLAQRQSRAPAPPAAINAPTPPANPSPRNPSPSRARALPKPPPRRLNRFAR
jgi:S1-C subfamily serine protease